MSLASQSRLSGEFCWWTRNALKLSLRDESSPA